MQHGDRTLAEQHGGGGQKPSVSEPSSCAGVTASQGYLEGKSGNPSPAQHPLAQSSHLLNSVCVEELVAL